jgi:isoquinoline 1-oxidoreductase subunit alpha
MRERIPRERLSRENTPMRLQINDKEHVVDGVDESTPLLWVLRDHLGLVGTKYGCGIGQCGACTVHLNGAPTRSCSLPISAAVGQRITTIEGLASKDGKLHPLQAAWIEHDVPQCGYCQAGQLMSAAALLKQKPDPTDADIDAAMNGNICRCGTYPRIRKAIHAAAKQAHE